MRSDWLGEAIEALVAPPFFFALTGPLTVFLGKHREHSIGTRAAPPEICSFADCISCILGGVAKATASQRKRGQPLPTGASYQSVRAASMCNGCQHGERVAD